jgi:hypothetical protein
VGLSPADKAAGYKIIDAGIGYFGRAVVFFWEAVNQNMDFTLI